MSLDFNGTTSRVTGPAITLGNTQTMFARFKPRTWGEGGFGVIAMHGPLATYRSLFYTWSAVPGGVLFAANWNPTNAIWYTAPGTVPYYSWRSIGASYDTGSAANQAALYVDGALSPNVTSPVPVGAPRADGGVLYVGSEPGGLLTLDGLLADFAVWNRVLSAREHALVHYLGPLAVPTNLMLYWPMDVDATDYSGNLPALNGTLVNTVASLDNPVRRSTQLSYILPAPLVPATVPFSVRSVKYDPATARLTYRIEED